MYKIFDADFTCPVTVGGEEEPAVRLAACDLVRNLRALRGKEDGFLPTPGKGISILTEPENSPGAPECYSVRISEEGIAIRGFDTLGTVYGVYAFASRVLGIDPMYRFSGLFPLARESLTVEDTAFSSRPKPTRFRGFFVNDEDLLTGFRPNGAKRDIDYPFYHDVIPVDLADMVFETALRLEMNLIIPSSFIDIMNPPEEAIIARAVARGLYVSQHHVEPLGVSFFTASNYIRDHGIGGGVSYFSNPVVMEEIWTAYAKKWSAYGDRVIWQLGLRGRADAPVWKTDQSVPDSPEARGALISGAINKQYEIIGKVLGHRRFLSTMTLWMEGADLYDHGFLTLPDDTIVVFGDIGHTQMFGDDLYRVRRNENTRYGVYYHVAYQSYGPHLGDATHPEKISFCLREAETHDALDYCILNVSNIREVQNSVRLFGAMMLDSPSEFDTLDYRQAWFDKIYGELGGRVFALDDMFFRVLPDGGRDLAYFRTKEAGFSWHEYESTTLPFQIYALDDGTIKGAGRNMMMYFAAPAEKRTKPTVAMRYLEDPERKEAFLALLEKASDEYDELLSKIGKTIPLVPEALVEHFFFTEYLRALTLGRMTRWLLSVWRMYFGEKIEEEREIGCRCLEDILTARRRAETGEWEGWYRDDKKIDIARLLRETKNYRPEERV